ncbi:MULTISPECIES: uS10/mL48 family ribosomal protein [Halobellus]|jgi:ribosomal protein S10|uniref:uS10/mL48 family ribosomal protein n=1 Tax=Halobellus TaxID=1073986 RepID=UPI000EF1BCD6|nr:MULTISPECIES: uS10/mL48 family ribosomal protein [Halobellus]MDQ2053577.1 uS10/mL48 family ribosomal protein [Halobellus sp. H-GB7]RLM94729.1 30S ribosomal protein S10 [Halobellus sp. Atlit-38R]
MTFVTKLHFQSGNRYELESEVSELKSMLERKGAECKGPHADPPETVAVPQYRSLQPGDEFSSWSYTVYSRKLEIHGNDHIAREVGHMDFPESLHVEIEVEQKKPLGHLRD